MPCGYGSSPASTMPPRSLGPRVHVGADELDLARLAALDLAFLAAARAESHVSRKGLTDAAPAGEALFSVAMTSFERQSCW